MKLERSDIDHPLWRKKVEYSLFRQNGIIYHCACRMWEIQKAFSDCISRTHPNSSVKVEFKGAHYKGWIMLAKEGRKTHSYRLWYAPSLSCELKDDLVYQS